MKFLVETNGKKHGTKFWFTVFASISAFRFLLSGVQIMGFAFPEVSAGELIALLGANGLFGGVYAWRQHTEAKYPCKHESEQEEIKVGLDR